LQGGDTGISIHRYLPETELIRWKNVLATAMVGMG
jgi:hypothetical protein